MNVQNRMHALSQVAPSPPANVGANGKADKNVSAGVTSADQAKVSAAASLASTSASEPDVRLEKVAAIRSAIENGSYQVPASDLAAKVISSLLSSEN